MDKKTDLEKEAQPTSTQPYYQDSKGRRFTAHDILFKGFKPSGKFKQDMGAVPKDAEHMGASVSEVLKNPPLNS